MVRDSLGKTGHMTMQYDQNKIWINQKRGISAKIYKPIFLCFQQMAQIYIRNIFRYNILLHTSFKHSSYIKNLLQI